MRSISADVPWTVSESRGEGRPAPAEGSRARPSGRCTRCSPEAPATINQSINRDRKQRAEGRTTNRQTHRQRKTGVKKGMAERYWWRIQTVLTQTGRRAASREGNREKGPAARLFSSLLLSPRRRTVQYSTVQQSSRPRFMKTFVSSQIPRLRIRRSRVTCGYPLRGDGN